jgi:murein DD-endopeptidase MepM/ murein hydrolase activator NlpD
MYEVQAKLRAIKAVICLTLVFFVAVGIYLLIPGDMGYQDVAVSYRSLSGKNAEATGEWLKPDRTEYLNDTARFVNSGANTFLFPIKGKNGASISVKLTTSFQGYLNISKYLHDGVDFANVEVGAPIIAASGGKIKNIYYNDKGWGNCIVVNDQEGTGYQYLYAHMVSFNGNPAIGDEVSAGQVIGYLGNTGNSTGAHLHYGMGGIGEPVGSFLVDPLQEGFFYIVDNSVDRVFTSPTVGNINNNAVIRPNLFKENDSGHVPATTAATG